MFLTRVLLVLDPRYKLEWFNKAGWRKEWIREARHAMKRLWNSSYKSTPGNDPTPGEVSTSRSSSFLQSLNKNLRTSGEDVDELSRYLQEQAETTDAIEKLSKENGGKDGVYCYWKVYQTNIYMIQEFICS